MTATTARRIARRTAISIAVASAVVLGWVALALMSGAMSEWLPGYAVWIPLGLFGLIRWSVWLSRRIPALLYRPMTVPYWTTAAVVVPVYQEDPAIFSLAMKSWLANRPSELIVVIDATDTRSIEIARAFPTAKVHITDVPGKRDALALGILAAKSDIVVLTDSDTIWERHTLPKILRPFADPKIGGVGTRQRVWQPQTIWQRFAQIYLDIRYDVEAPALTRVGRAVSCLSGRTAAYRRQVLLPLLDSFLNERFFGKRCMTGEDKRLTSLILRAGYDTYHQDDAVVYSTFPPDFGTFLKQRVRWTRNTYRSDLGAMWDGWVWDRAYLAFMLVDRLISPYALLIGLIYFASSIVTRQWGIAFALAAWWLISRAIKIAPHLRRQPADFMILPQYIALTFFMAVVKVYAMATVHHHKWLTREVEVVNDQVVRNAAGTHDRTPWATRLAGAALAIAFFAAVQGAFFALGGFGFDRTDTAPPTIHVAAPNSVPEGTHTMLVAEAVDLMSPELQFIWTIDGSPLGEGAVVRLPAGLAAGTHTWALHVRDAAGNTATRTGQVDVAARASDPTAATPTHAPEPTPTASEPPTTGAGPEAALPDTATTPADGR